MKKKRREVFMELASEIDWNLCGFCRYSRSDGYVCDEDSFSECEHPIEAIGELSQDICNPYDDCWGFSPFVSLSMVADIVGVMLSENFDPQKTQWSKDEKGVVHIEGFKLKS